MHEMIRCTRPHMATGVWHDAAAAQKQEQEDTGYTYGRARQAGPFAAMNARRRCKVQQGRRRTNMPSALPCPSGD